MNKKIAFVSAFVLTSIGAFAQENDSIKNLNEVLVSDSKFALAKEKSGKVIVKITAQELEKKSGQSLATILSSVAGVEINGNQSGSGKNLGYYVRGARNRQTLIMIDGIPVTDASGINLEYDLRLIPVEQVESIEILKGASSTLYGTGAAAGVINITLKEATKKEIAGNAYMSFGSQQTTNNTKKYEPQDYSEGFAVNGTVNKFNYYATLNSTETTGISEASAPVNTTYETDAFSKVNSLVKLGFKATSKLDLNFFANYDRIKNDFDSGFDNFSNPDTNLNNSISEQFRFGFSPKYKYNKGEFVLNSAFNTIERNYNVFNSWTSVVDASNYKSRNASIDAFNKYSILEQLFVVVGGQFQFNEMNSVTQYDNISKEIARFSSIDPYVTAVYNSDFGLNINAGARYNTHNIYGNHFVYNVNPSFSFKELPLKLLASYSTAYITPSLYQLYSPYGNLLLTPEESATAEAGFETNLLNKKLMINAVVFQREDKNSIGFYTDPSTYVSNYVNVDGKIKTKGVETMISCAFSDKLKVNGNYSFTQPEEKLNRLIPKHKGNVSLDYQVTSRTFFNVNYQYVDKRTDAFFDGGTFATTQIVLDSYKLVNATVKYELIKSRFNIYLAATNILNEDFVESVGYSTRGRNFKLGFNFLF
ncbi:MAG: TonB-dependent receptor plug domain-containing protein [Flavobacterium sp.]|uniref:TonB-dependent receptor plug domain-containing protein n=1 Tax=Flavobacterium sp. TaxID=239 RepID=UPI0032654A6F